MREIVAVGSKLTPKVYRMVQVSAPGAEFIEDRPARNARYPGRVSHGGGAGKPGNHPPAADVIFTPT
jgi:hypothetical protein